MREKHATRTSKSWLESHCWGLYGHNFRRFSLSMRPAWMVVIWNNYLNLVRAVYPNILQWTVR